MGWVSNIEVEKKQKLEKNWVVGPFSPRWGKIIIVSVTFFLTTPWSDLKNLVKSGIKWYKVSLFIEKKEGFEFLCHNYHRGWGRFTPNLSNVIKFIF